MCCTAVFVCFFFLIHSVLYLLCMLHVNWSDVVPNLGEKLCFHLMILTTNLYAIFGPVKVFFCICFFWNFHIHHDFQKQPLQQGCRLGGPSTQCSVGVADIYVQFASLDWTSLWACLSCLVKNFLKLQKKKIVSTLFILTF
uniref:Uncharacterized protein n=1 Tax=Davidia involucrata TaxID=16924 RepID=A0A5B7C2J5_DAVIN